MATKESCCVKLFTKKTSDANISHNSEMSCVLHKDFIYFSEIYGIWPSIAHFTFRIMKSNELSIDYYMKVNMMTIFHLEH